MIYKYVIFINNFLKFNYRLKIQIFCDVNFFRMHKFQSTLFNYPYMILYKILFFKIWAYNWDDLAIFTFIYPTFDIVIEKKTPFTMLEIETRMDKFEKLFSDFVNLLYKIFRMFNRKLFDT